MHASGVTQAKGTLTDLIDKYTTEVYALKPWGRSKTADLKRLRKDLGSIAVADLTSLHITRYFQRRREAGSGGVTISGQVGYLITVLKVARTVWHMDTPIQAARDARTALSEIRLIRKSNRCDRRVTDAEIKHLLAHFHTCETNVSDNDQTGKVAYSRSTPEPSVRPFHEQYRRRVVLEGEQMTLQIQKTPAIRRLNVLESIDSFSAAHGVRMTESALAQHRYNRTGPEYTLILRRVYYTADSIDAWIAKKVADSRDSQQRAEQAQL
jgi:hypothetical protein